MENEKKEMIDSSENRITLEDIWILLKKNLLWILLAGFIGVVIGFVFSNYVIEKNMLQYPTFIHLLHLRMFLLVLKI